MGIILGSVGCRVKAARLHVVIMDGRTECRFGTARPHPETVYIRGQINVYI